MGAKMAEFLAIAVAEWIERGLEFVSTAGSGFEVRESQRAFLDITGSTYRAGALGLAVIGKEGHPRAALERWKQAAGNAPADPLEAAAHVLGISVALARLVELNHRGGVAARDIARSLRAGALGMAMVTYHPSAPRAEAPAMPFRLMGRVPGESATDGHSVSHA
jgi:hypothetical protein